MSTSRWFATFPYGGKILSFHYCYFGCHTATPLNYTNGIKIMWFQPSRAGHRLPINNRPARSNIINATHLPNTASVGQNKEQCPPHQINVWKITPYLTADNLNKSSLPFPLIVLPRLSFRFSHKILPCSAARSQ